MTEINSAQDLRRVRYSIDIAALLSGTGDYVVERHRFSARTQKKRLDHEAP
jgi:hypothetical protein